MAISRGPKLVTNGLSLYLDAANSSSYSGTGSTWYDVSGNNRNATLFNTPTYSTTNAGIFTFDDTSFEYATVPNIGSLTNFTIDT